MRGNSPAIPLSTAIPALGWKSVAVQLLASGVLLLSGYQDMGLRVRAGAAFGFFVATASSSKPRQSDPPLW
jgi:hypothetical protein